MPGASGQRILIALCGLAAVTAAGCADLDILPSWVPFQGPASDKLPGVVTPAERIAELRKLSDKAAASSAAEKQQISQQLADVDPDGERPADPHGDHSHAWAGIPARPPTPSSRRR